jgi:hypothetical protein
MLDHNPAEQAITMGRNAHDIVLADNLSSHKVPGVRQAIETCGANLLL